MTIHRKKQKGEVLLTGQHRRPSGEDAQRLPINGYKEHGQQDMNTIQSEISIRARVPGWSMDKARR